MQAVCEIPSSTIIGNSRGFAIESARLGRGTGRSFVHLTLEAAYPQDQLKLLATFARHQAGRACDAPLANLDDLQEALRQLEPSSAVVLLDATRLLARAAGCRLTGRRPRSGLQAAP